MKKDELYGKINQLPIIFGWQEYAKVMVAKDSVLELVRQLDEPQKPVIPKFVAEWIEKYGIDRDQFEIVWLAKNYVNGITSLNLGSKKVTSWIAYNAEVFIRAWSDGYTIEREKLYTVEIPDDNNKAFTHTILTHTEDGDLRVAFTDVPDWKKEKRHHLTESEIRKDFEWAWQWAEEVKEVDR